MVAFRREKFVPRGGPSGGDGGKGGSVILQAKQGLTTLFDLRYRRILVAEDGVGGSTKNMHGRCGVDYVAKVPVGTLIYDADTGELLGDLVEDGQILVAAVGGRGGRGNARFTTPTNQAPRRAEDGRQGGIANLRLELKLLADVGLIGYPSVGKSTLIRHISNARPKVAAYPFTTLIPHLGVVPWKGYTEFVVADIPGIIEGASEGKGLGHQFLRHIERTRVLVHLIEVTDQLEGQESRRDPIKDYERLNEELGRFDEGLATRPQIVALNKLDLPLSKEREAEIRAYFTGRGIELFAISAFTGEGIEALVDAMGTAVARRDAEEDEAADDW